MENEQNYEQSYKNSKNTILIINITIILLTLFLMGRITYTFIDTLNLINQAGSSSASFGLGIELSKSGIIRIYITCIALLIGIMTLIICITQLISRLYDATYNHEKILNQNEENK